MSSTSSLAAACDGRVGCRVAFFQRIFAQYQTGLVRELVAHSPHTYHFFGDARDPMYTGIMPMEPDLCAYLPFTYCRTTHFSPHLAFQWRAPRVALWGAFDTYILEGSFTYPTNWLALLAARARGRRVLLYGHGWKRYEHGAVGRARRAFFYLADGLLLYGQRARAIGVAHGFPPERLHVVYNSLDEESMRPWRQRVTEDLCQEFRRAQFGPAAARTLLASVGRLTAAKQYHLLIEAAVQLRNAGREVNLLLVGAGPERDALEASARAAGVRLAVTGARYDEEFLSLCFASADATVIPGAAGLTVVHSLSYGTPVIVHDNDERQMPESEAVQAGVNGARFRCGQPEDLAAAVGRVLATLPRGPRTHAQCRRVVEEKYNPVCMREAFDRAVSGLLADDPAKAPGSGEEIR